MAIGSEADVIVIGGGPAGATASTLIAQKGHRVTLFEREHFPRFHIGESLIPETYWVLERLKMLPKLRKSHFTEKYSVQFVNYNGKTSAPFDFWDNKPHECSQTWQVLRSEFDKMMLDNAAEQGVDVHEGIRVLDILFEGERAVGVRIKTEAGEEQEVRAKAIVDASGQSSMIINKFKLKISDPQLNKGAIWTYFKGAHRAEGRNGGATLVLQVAGKKGWFWYIPLHNDVTSIGVVADFEYLFKDRGSDFEKTFWEEVERCPGVKERIAGAEVVDKIRTTKDYTYRSKQIAGDGWVLVGDAFGFLDPLYSSGVLLALKSGTLAADAVSDGLEKGDTSAAQLGHWGPAFIEGMDRMRRLVCEYYDGLNFGQFIRKYPHHQGDVTDLLIGDLFEPERDNVLKSIDEFHKEALSV
ncbi:NAD(P)/FAD-dependent oxidoreductase [Planctomicrobium piriforme]|uniref:Dehydrogenase (Flavoprotein) n=1 Tax=Planctomicrobium piriforme TaxID=1576369 RepID=A0A1I3LMA2_9PLAN|nr:NAD(P)/FAD-dependent oxidoreductase [Planctomicrobium piriforme]SFI85842.1 Dehydrogenase (flavoprotein) [Planctomicrobium piriforme]